MTTEGSRCTTCLNNGWCLVQVPCLVMSSAFKDLASQSSGFKIPAALEGGSFGVMSTFATPKTSLQKLSFVTMLMDTIATFTGLNAKLYGNSLFLLCGL